MDDYAKRGYGGGGIGFGKRIGIAVVDFQLAFTHARFPLGGAPLTERAVVNTAILLRAARAARLPVVSCRRYADVVDLQTCLDYIAPLPRANA